MPGLESYVRRVQSTPAAKPRSVSISAKREEGARLARGGSAIIRPMAQGLPDPIDSMIGMIGFFPLAAPPSGWLACEGQFIGLAAYPLLAAHLQREGVDLTLPYRLPDLRGVFIRGLDRGRGIDPNREVGTEQDDAIAMHAHELVEKRIAAEAGNVTVAAGPHSGDFPNVSLTSYTVEEFETAGSETRPINVALLGCIRVA